MPRRILAIALLIALGFPLVAPALTAADPEASLPACCRSHGAHHCAMLHSLLQQQPPTPAFVPPPCPFYPTSATAPRLSAASLAGPINLSVGPLRSPAPPAAIPSSLALTSAASANLKRGPPSLA